MKEFIDFIGEGYFLDEEAADETPEPEPGTEVVNLWSLFILPMQETT